MIISATPVRHVKKMRVCPVCDLPIVTKAIRLYGAAETYDPPYRIYVHPECAGHCYDKREQAKVDKAVAALEEPDGPT